MSKICNLHFSWLVSFQKLFSKINMIYDEPQKSEKSLANFILLIIMFISLLCYSEVPELYELWLCLFFKYWILFRRGDPSH